MDVYKKLEYSAKDLYRMSNSLERHYNKVNLIKKNGEIRELRVPDKHLKLIQRNIADKLLKDEEISKYATAYVSEKSISDNARPHIGNPVILKLDIRKFFDHISYSMVKEKVFKKEKYLEEIRILLSVLCVYEHTVPQGAPTSPFISNIIMKDFDDIVGKWCDDNNIIYTRYCDDMTFSGNFNPEPVIKLVKKELLKRGFFLNDKKTIVLRNGQKKEVTGIIVNEKLSIPKAYKKKIRQEIYYCKKFGIKSNIAKLKLNISKVQYVNSLAGRVNYVLSIEKDNEEMLNYRKWLNDIRNRDDFNPWKTNYFKHNECRQMELFDYRNFEGYDKDA